MIHLTYLEAAVVGLIQGVSELFPVSSLGHNVLIPALLGGQWAADLDVSKPESPYLAFIVGLHVATAMALLVYFWRDWVRIAGGFVSSVRERRVETADQRLAWMIVLATIPVGLVGLVAEHPFRLIFGKPVVAGAFLAVNGVILIAGERFRRQASLDADARIAAGRRLEPVAAGGRMAPDGCGYGWGGSGSSRVRPGGCGSGGCGPGGGGPGGRPPVRPPPRLRRPRSWLTGACRLWGTAGPSSSDRPRSWRCWPGSAGMGSPWWRACAAGWPGRTPCGSPSCSPPR